jgi:hypothetical protein
MGTAENLHRRRNAPAFARQRGQKTAEKTPRRSRRRMRERSENKCRNYATMKHRNLIATNIYRVGFRLPGPRN